MLTLAIETSCDETSASVLDGVSVLSNIISTQLFHSEFGGVVPEVASREHLKKIIPVTNEALKEAGVSLQDIDLICGTTEPGLIGALLVGANFAKSLSVSLGKPFVPVNHIKAHLYSPFIGNERIDFPFLGLIISGGHTLLILVEGLFRHRIIGKTIDDAAGEAFDKAAKLLGLGYPGGRLIDDLAKEGDPEFHKFPKAVIKNSEFDFSFSGIKTSLLYYLRKHFSGKLPEGDQLRGICASYQRAIVDMLFEKTFRAAVKFGVKNVAVSGGVSANSGVRGRFGEMRKEDYIILFPESEYTSDNAAMIGFAGFLEYNSSKSDLAGLSVHARPRIDYENF